MTRATLPLLVSFALASSTAAAVAPGLAPDPGAAALRAFGGTNGRPRVVRIDRRGDFATVLLSGAVIEGSPLTEAVLAERFASGWQLLTNVRSACSLDPYLSRASAAPLLRGMPIARGTDCDPHEARDHDSGPPADVDAVRVTMRDGVFVPVVRVVGRYAMLSWFGAGGGETFLRKDDGGAWTGFAGGGGAYRAGELTGKGVPPAVACELLGYHGGCDPASL